MTRGQQIAHRSTRSIGRRRQSAIFCPHLPAEILTEIFELTIMPHPFEYPIPTEFSKKNWQLWHLLLVCRHWNAVIMGYPRFWSSLAFTSVEATLFMLRRSKDSPLVVKVDFVRYWNKKPPVQQAVLLALTNLPRVRVLHSNDSENFLQNFVTAVMYQPAPLLESLRLTCPSRRLTLPQPLFADATPRLRHLAVCGPNVSWRSPLLANLTHLEIRDSELTPSLAEFYDVLSRCPALDTLILTNTLPAASEQLQPQVSLPRLSHLQLVGDMADCNFVIRSISFPLTTAVSLRSPFAPGPQLRQLLTNLRGKVSTIVSLWIQVSPKRSDVQAWPTVVDPSAFEDPLLTLYFWSLHRTSFFPAICEGLALTNIVSLEVTVLEQGPDAWKDIAVDFGTFRNLQVLSVSCWDASQLISALEPTAERVVPLPGLRKFILEDVRSGPSTIHDLQVCLIRRRDNNAEVEKLELNGWVGLRKFDVDMLKDSLGDVIEWDKRES